MKLITITGPSGTGKDTIARIMSEMTDWPIICSYTTRPMRKGEQEGREHHFVKEFNVDSANVLAYTQYGGYEYWATVDQVKDIAIYIVDEVGLVDMKKRHPEIQTYSFYVKNSAVTRLARGVKLSRILRDVDRLNAAMGIKFDRKIFNNGGMSKEDLRYKVAQYVCTMPFVMEKLDPFGGKSSNLTE